MKVSNTSLETVSGIIIDVHNPNRKDISITDIAWALSNLNRFGGHTIVGYSVAQHSIQVSKYIEEVLKFSGIIYDDFLQYVLLKHDFEQKQCLEFIVKMKQMAIPKIRRLITLHGLAHDFSEAYLVDLPAPVKRLPGLHESYLLVENRINNVINNVFGIEYPNKETEELSKKIVHWADVYALMIEAYNLMPSKGMNWNIDFDLPSIEILNSFEKSKTQKEVYNQLLKRFYELQ